MKITVLLFFGLAPLSLHAAVVTIPLPVADTFVNSLNPNSNYGGAGAMQLAAPGNAKGEFQSLIRFDVAAAFNSFNTTFGAGQWAVDGVTLSLSTNFGMQGVQPNNPIFASINAGLFAVRWMQNDAWAEGTGNPNSPTTDGVTFNTLSSVLSPNDLTLGSFQFTAPGNNTLSTYGLGLPAGFVSDLQAGGLVSFDLLAADSAVSYLFNTRTFGSGTQRPQLIISASAAPEPTSTMLLLGALALLPAARRRA